MGEKRVPGGWERMVGGGAGNRRPFLGTFQGETRGRTSGMVGNAGPGPGF